MVICPYYGLSEARGKLPFPAWAAPRTVGPQEVSTGLGHSRCPQWLLPLQAGHRDPGTLGSEAIWSWEGPESDWVQRPGPPLRDLLPKCPAPHPPLGSAPPERTRKFTRDSLGQPGSQNPAAGRLAWGRGRPCDPTLGIPCPPGQDARLCRASSIGAMPSAFPAVST